MRARETFHRLLCVAGLAAFAAPAVAELPITGPDQFLGPTSAEVWDGESIFTPYFGNDIAVAGATAAVGLPGAYDSSGRVAVFTRNSSGVWNRTATLQGAATAKSFGSQVAVAQGRIVAVSKASVYLFAYNAGVWRQTQKFGLGSAAQVQDVAWNGTFAAVSVTESNSSRFVYVYKLTSTGVLQRIAKLAPSDAVFADEFGATVRMFSNTLAVGAPGYNSRQGAAYVFTCSATACRQQQKLLANDGSARDAFGASLDVRGRVLVVGAPGHDLHFGDHSQPASPTNYTASGAAYVFVLPSTTGAVWTELDKLRPTPEQANVYLSFGADIALTKDRLLAGAGGYPGLIGATPFVYSYSGVTFTPLQRVTGSDRGPDTAVMSERTVFTGYPDGSQGSGRVEVFNVQ